MANINSILRPQIKYTIFLLISGLFIRLLFLQSFYLPPDSLDYLNALDGFRDGQLQGIIRYVRLGMVIPLAFLGLVSANLHYIYFLYPLASSIGCIWLCMRIGHILAGERASLLAGTFIAFLPMEVVYGGIILPDSPLSFYSLAAFYITLRVTLREIYSPWSIVVAGMLLGIAYTCKVTALFFAPAAAIQLFLFRRRFYDVMLFCFGLVFVIGIEILLLFQFLDAWHLRIYETFGFAIGDKGNYVTVNKTFLWWIEQVVFKLGALFFAVHKPTAALLITLPHMVVIATLIIWRNSVRIKGLTWVGLWGGLFLGQQLLLSTIEPEPRLMLPALPYLVIVCGVVLSGIWNLLDVKLRFFIFGMYVIVSFLGAFSFWATHKPGVEIVGGLFDKFNEIKDKKEYVFVESPSRYVGNLAHYAGLKNNHWDSYETKITHWSEIYNGYTKYRKFSGPDDMKLLLDMISISPIRPFLGVLGFVPAVGETSRVVLYGIKE